MTLNPTKMVHYVSSANPKISTESRAEKDADRMHNPNEVDAKTTGKSTVDK
jgi:hypothetical protein